MKENKISELELMFNYFTERRKQQKFKTFSSNELDVGSNLDNLSVLYYYLCDLRGFSKLPKIVSDKEYTNIKKDSSYVFSAIGREYYHGFQDINHGASYLWDSYYHYGEGDFGNGFYMTSNPIIANMYTRDFNSNIKPRKETSADRVMKAKLLTGNVTTLGDLKSLNYYLIDENVNGYAILSKRNYDYSALSQEKLEKEMQRVNKFKDLVLFFKNIESEEQKKDFLYAFTTNPSAMAVYLDFDYSIRGINLDDSDEQIMVFNRNCLAVSESEANRVFELSGDKYSWIVNQK